MQDFTSEILWNIIHKLPNTSKCQLAFSNKKLLLVVNQYFQFQNPIFKNNFSLFDYLQVSPLYFSISQFRNTCLHCKQFSKLNQKLINICEHCFVHNISYFKINKQQLQAILKSNLPDFLSQYDLSIQSYISPQSKKYLLKSVLDYAIRTQNTSVIQLIYDLHQERIQIFLNQQQELQCSSLIDDLNLNPLDKERLLSLPLLIQFFQHKNYTLIDQIQVQLSFIKNYQSILINNIHSVLSSFPQLRFSKKINQSTNQQVLDQLLSLYNISLSNSSPIYNQIFSLYQPSKNLYSFILMDAIQNLQENLIFNQFDQFQHIQHLVSQMIGLNFHNTTLNSNFQKQFLLAAQFFGSNPHLKSSYQLFMTQTVSLFLWFDTATYDISKLPPRIFIFYMFYMQVQHKPIS